MFHIFRIPSWRTIAQRQQEEAMRQHLEHVSAAELHQALAAMYAKRAKRLEAALSPTNRTPVAEE